VNALSVGLFTYSTLPRGSVVHTANLADALHDAGADVTVYALDKDARGFFRPLSARLVLVPASHTPASTAELVNTRARELADHLDRARPSHDVYHAEDCLTANGLLEHRARGHALDMVRTVHHVEAFADPFLEGCQRRSIVEAALCLAVSEATARDVASAFGVQTKPTTNGVDVDRFANADPLCVAGWARTLHVAVGPVVLAVGGVEERKNTMRILRAFVRVHEEFADARLWILGGATVLDHGAYRAAFDRELESLPPEVRAAVTPIGVVGDGDVPAIFRLASVLAFPSLHEGFGLAALEGLAAGIPVVASRRAPMTEFLDDACAILVDPTSDAAIARGISCALRAPLERRAAGYRRALSLSWSRVAAQHIDHYRVLSSDARSRREGTAEVRHA
jgi:glycosyltransferase-like protein